MGASQVKLKLDLTKYDETKFVDQIAGVERHNITFSTMLELGDHEDNRQRLYELNKICSSDVPGRGEFYTYKEYCRSRYGSSYDPAHAIIAGHASDWIGLAVNSNWSHKGFLFSEMTGVLREHRGKNIGLVMKIHGIRAAIRTGAKVIYTVTTSDNVGAIGMNRRLGFVFTDWDTLL